MEGARDDDNHRHVRLLPWTGTDGKRCYLLGDGTGTGVLSRHADHIEAVQLGLAGKLLDRARQLTDVLDTNAQTDQLGLLASQLTLALHDALLIAESRGARLAHGLPSTAVDAVGRGTQHADDPAATNPARRVKCGGARKTVDGGQADPGVVGSDRQQVVDTEGAHDCEPRPVLLRRARECLVREFPQQPYCLVVVRFVDGEIMEDLRHHPTDMNVIDAQDSWCGLSRYERGRLEFGRHLAWSLSGTGRSGASGKNFWDVAYIP
ncbi:hypothetical protein ACFYPC_01500 [Streptomyces sp. NPDC005808]|uniref:hypothetical protein n=1 Tax=Streptomyces sp. NPDC005808 TaxID=3364734 RepID=UPI0036AE798A